MLMMILTACAVSEVPPVALTLETTSTVPYLYYYSSLLDTFVVERADGQDGFTLGQDILEVSGRMQGMAWSNTGKWLAWWGNLYGRPPGPSQIANIWVIRVDGSGQTSVFTPIEQETIRLIDAVWSPTDDRLLVAYTRSECRSYDDVMYVRIYDAGQGEILLDSAMNTSLRSCGGGHLPNVFRWSPDGHAFAYPYELKNGQYGYTVFHLLDGQASNTTLSLDVAGSRTIFGYLWFELASYGSNHWLVVDPFTGYTATFDPLTFAEIPSAIQSGEQVTHLRTESDYSLGMYPA